MRDTNRRTGTLIEQCRELARIVRYIISWHVIVQSLHPPPPPSPLGIINYNLTIRHTLLVSIIDDRTVSGIRLTPDRQQNT
jgi:hypothetical protein